MADEVKDVNPAEPSAAEQVVKEPVSDPQAVAPAVSETPAPLPEGNLDVDDRGVPWKNVAMEYKRKGDELAEKLPQLIEEKLSSFVQSQGAQQREYSIAELEQYALDNPQYRPWVEERKEEIRLKKLTEEVDKKIKNTEQYREANIKKQQSLQYVMQSYPEAFSKNQNGQIIGWNNNHPLTQQIGLLMQDKRFANDPDGLSAAADIAYARHIRNQQPIAIKKEQQMKAEIKDLQKATLVEAGGKQPVEAVPEHRAAINKFKQSLSLQDAGKAVDLMMRANRASKNQE